MARILFVTWDGGGNVAPAVAIAHELRARGDEIRFLGQAGQRAALEAEGFGFAAFSSPGPWTATGTRNGVENVVGFLRLLVGRSLGRDLVREVGEHPVDLVVIDCLLYGVLDAAIRERIPHAVLVHSLFRAVEQTMAKGAPGGVARLTGLDPWRLWTHTDLLIAATLEEFDIRPTRPIRLEYVGPIIPQPSRPADGSTAVLVSLSTTYVAGQEPALQRIVDALADLPVRAVVTTGPAIDPARIRAWDAVEVHQFVPHARLMPTVSLVVGHGGHSTTMLALAHDLPLVILPMNLAFDQPIIGRRIEELGAGVCLPAKATAATIGEAIARVLADDAYRTAAAGLGGSIRATSGAAAAADLIGQRALVA